MFGNEMEILNQGERHVACVLLVDVSTSMRGQAMNELNEGLKQFKKALEEDSLARGRADVCVVSFASSVEQVVPFTPAVDFAPPVLTAGGATAMNEALITALDLMDMQKKHYKDYGVDYYQPWLFLLTDGEPTDDDLKNDAHLRIQDALTRGGFQHMNFFPMGIGNEANVENLKSYYPENWKEKTVLKATKNNFKEAFVWISKSLTAVVHSNPGEKNLNTPSLPQTISIVL